MQFGKPSPEIGEKVKITGAIESVEYDGGKDLESEYTVAVVKEDAISEINSKVINNITTEGDYSPINFGNNNTVKIKK